MAFINTGTRNKGAFWEYISAYSFLYTQLPDTKFDIPLFLGMGEGIHNMHCHHTDNIAHFRDVLFPEEFESGVYSDEFFERFRRVYLDDARLLQKLLADVTYASLTNRELADMLFMSIQYISSTHKTMLLGFYTAYLEKYIQTVFYEALSAEERGNAVRMQEQLALLLTTPEASFADLEQEALFQIKQSYGACYGTYTDHDFDVFVGQPEIVMQIGALVREYGWFHMEYMQLPLTAADYVDQLRKRLKHDDGATVLSPKKAKGELRKAQGDFFLTHPRSEKLQKLMQVLHKMSLVLDETKVEAVRGHHLITPMLFEIAKRLQSSRDDILMVPAPELTKRLYADEPLEAGVVALYRKKRAVLLWGGHITWYSGDSAKRIEDRFLEKDEVPTSQEVSGSVAFPGKYTGPVTVVRSIEDKHKFTPGDVLVTHDGTAELTMFLQQAGAIVTDQGGIICHAAIVAREMKTPAIVGTKIATQVLHDGDLVEVDAERGLLRVIERAK